MFISDQYGPFGTYNWMQLLYINKIRSTNYNRLIMELQAKQGYNMAYKYAVQISLLSNNYKICFMSLDWEPKLIQSESSVSFFQPTRTHSASQYLFYIMYKQHLINTYYMYINKINLLNCVYLFFLYSFVYLFLLYFLLFHFNH